MKKFRTSKKVFLEALVLLVTTAFALQTEAAVYRDDFSGGINSSHWTVNSGIFTVDDSLGSIHISKSFGGSGAPSEWARIHFNHALYGNFEISVDYRDANLSGCQNQIQLNLVFGGQYAANRRENWCESRYSVWLDPPQSTVGATGTSDTAGTLRITRTGSTVRFYANNTMIYEGVFNNSPVTDLWLSLQNNGSADAISVTFDNFSVVADSIEGICVPPPSGMISWWGGDNNALDIAGSNHGTLMNGATYTQGKVRQAFSFDGIDDYVVVPDSPSLDITTQFTLDAWVYSKGNPGGWPDKAIISKVGGSGGNNGYQMGLTPDGANWKVFCIFNANGEGWPANFVVGGTVTNNVWYHIACTYDNNDLKIYVNGILVGAKNVGAKSVVNSSSTLRISGDDNDHAYFYGYIDEPEVFNRALTAEEIATIYNAGSSGKCFTADTTPDAFIFTDQTDVDVNKVITSNTITVSGINTPVAVSISSCTGTDCEYQINGGTWTSDAGTVQNGDAVAVRQRSSGNYSTQTDLTLDIGGVTDTFSVTTMPIPQYTLTVIKSGTGTGTVMSSPAGIDCGSDCTEEYDYNTQVVLKAVADTGSAFAGWSGDCSGSDAEITVTMDKDRSCTATFTLNEYTIITTADPQAGGSIVCNPNPVNHGSVSVCTIITNTGYTLQSVTGTCGGSLNGDKYTTDTIVSDCMITAVFAINRYTLMVDKSGTGTGTVASSPAGIDCGSDCMEEYNYNTQVILNAVADTGSAFAGWSGDCSGSDAEITVTMDKDRSCTATFVIKSETDAGYDAGNDTGEDVAVQDVSGDATEDVTADTITEDVVTDTAEDIIADTATEDVISDATVDGGEDTIDAGIKEDAVSDTMYDTGTDVFGQDVYVTDTLRDTGTEDVKDIGGIKDVLNVADKGEDGSGSEGCSCSLLY